MLAEWAAAAGATADAVRFARELLVERPGAAAIAVGLAMLIAESAPGGGRGLPKLKPNLGPGSQESSWAGGQG